MAEQPQLSLSLLGTPSITMLQHGHVSLTNRKALALLAYLAVESNQVHSRETVLGLLWPDLPQADARNNLRVTWSQLRSKVGDDFLLSSRIEMQFDLRSSHWLDVTDFNNLLAACTQHAHTSRNTCPDCQQRLARAAALYRGEFLAGLTLNDCPIFDEWQFVLRERLHLQMLDALEDLALFHTASGQFDVAERYARRQLALDPLRETAHRQLMDLLDKQGQRSAALEQFERCKQILARELNIEPEPETLLLATRIRKRMAGPQQAPRHNLPTPTTRFLGRTNEMALLIQHLNQPDIRLMTLLGSGGVGKTRLALQMAHSLTEAFSDGVWLVTLASLSDPQSVERAVAAALGLREQAGISLLQALSNFVRDKQLLLVMDNCEHLLTSCATLVAQLLADGPGLKVLATSRSALHVEGEVAHRVPSLSLPTNGWDRALSPETLLGYEAIQFFVSRAAMAQPHFALTTNNAAAVMQICARLDGIPLALELAAARLSVMPLETIARRLDSRFKILTSDSPTALPRHRTLLALVEWSYNLLTAGEQAMLRRLSVFAGGWTFEAAEAICDDAAAPSALFDLVNHSLVLFGGNAEHGRYRMLETIRQYAREQLQTCGEERAACARHAHHFSQVVAEAAHHANRPTHQHTLDQMELEHDNVLAALGWAMQHHPELALQLAANLGGGLNFWELRGHFEEARLWLGRLVHATENSRSPARARVLLDAAWMARARPDYAQALAYAQASANLYDKLGDPRGKLDAELFKVGIWNLQQALTESQALAEVCLRQAEELGYKPAMALALYELGSVESDHNRFETAKTCFERSIQLWREVGDLYQLAAPLNYLAAELHAHGEVAEAKLLYEELEDIHRTLGYERGLALTQNNLGCLLMAQGELARAKALFTEGLHTRRKMGLLRGYVYSLLNFATLAETESQPQRSARLYGAAEALCLQIGLPGSAVHIESYAEVFARLRTTLGEERFALEWARGRRLTAEQAADIALQG